MIGAVAYYALGNDIQNYANVLDYLSKVVKSEPSALLAVTTGIFYAKIVLVQVSLAFHHSLPVFLCQKDKISTLSFYSKSALTLTAHNPYCIV